MYTMQQSLPSSPSQPSLKFASHDTNYKLVKYGTGYKEKMVYKCLQSKRGNGWALHENEQAVSNLVGVSLNSSS